jgi:hypothetical protein
MTRTPIEQENDFLTPFSSFNEEFTHPQDDKEYEEMDKYPISFDSDSIKLKDETNMELIIKEMNEISSLQFKYRLVMNTQTKIVQIVEDVYTKWYAGKWMDVDSEEENKYDRQGVVIGQKRIERTEGAKEKVVITRFPDEYESHKSKIRDEKHKLELIKTTVASIESYSFKLHSILNYNEMLQGKGIRP